MKQRLSHSWVEISERALMHNIRAHRSLLGKKTKLMAVVKSNAYGHGMELVARVAEKSKQVDWLGIVSLNEAIELRRAGIRLPILILSYYRPFDLSTLVWGIKHNISFVVYGTDQLNILERAAKKAGKKALVHLKLETCMARLGRFSEDAIKMLKLIRKSSSPRLEGIFSHFATAEDKNQNFLNEQINTYKDFIKKAGELIPKNILQHHACSAAISTAPQSHLSLVRLGIGLYGLWPSPENKVVVNKKHKRFNLVPALTWKTQIIEVQKIPPHTPVGYGRSFITKKPTTMASIPVGYWDGYDRGLGNCGSVLIHGTKCPIIGRICMNISMVDVTGLKNVKAGDEVILIGRQSGGEVSTDAMADKIGTINYEVVTRINPLLPRILV